MWAPPQLMYRGGEEEQKPGAALRLPPPVQVGLGHRRMARVWLREQMGQTGEVEGHLGATWPYPQQFLHWVYLLEEYARSIVREREKSRIEEPIVSTSRRVDGNDNGGGSLALPGLCVGVVISGGEDAYVLGVEDPLRKAREELLRVLWEEGKREGVDGELCFVGGEAEGQPGRLAHRERFVKLAGKGVEIWREGRGGGGRVGDEKGHRSTVIDLGGDCKGEDAIRISQDAGSDV